jgi:hypothetical protein
MTTVTGNSSSRLFELRKFSDTGTDIGDLYFTSTNVDTDGVNESLSDGISTWIYYIGGITYTDIVSNNITTTSFEFQSVGDQDENNFDQFEIIKNELINDAIYSPEINNNVFIIRQSLSVFENIFRLESVNTIAELQYYAGNNNFNIIDNT